MMTIYRMVSTIIINVIIICYYVALVHGVIHWARLYYQILLYYYVLTAVRQYDEIVNGYQPFPSHIIRQRRFHYSTNVKLYINHSTVIIKTRVWVIFSYPRPRENATTLIRLYRSGEWQMISFDVSTTPETILLCTCTRRSVLSDSEKIDIHPVAVRRRRSRASPQPCAVEFGSMPPKRHHPRFQT